MKAIKVGVFGVRYTQQHDGMVGRITPTVYAVDYFPDGTVGPFVPAHFKGNAKQRRVARRSYIRFAKATCAARGIPLYINGILQ